MFTVLSRNGVTLPRESGPDLAVSLVPEIETLSLPGGILQTGVVPSKPLDHSCCSFKVLAIDS